MKNNATNSAALRQRISLQNNHTIDLNKWIFDRIGKYKAKSILELCSGTGAQTQYLRTNFTDACITCVDISDESMRRSKGTNGTSRIEYVVADIDETDHYLNRTYDLIFCSYGFYYSKDWPALHYKLRRCILPGGKIVIVGPIRGNNRQLFDIVRSIGAEIPAEVYSSSETFMLDLLTAFVDGYPTVSLHRVMNNITYDSVEALFRYWSNTTFYDSRFNDAFLEKAASYFSESPVIITKSIGYLEATNEDQ